VPIAILLQPSALKAPMGYDPTIGDAAQVATWAASFLMNGRTVMIRANTRMG
jgi:hypothetical protein